MNKYCFLWTLYIVYNTNLKCVDLDCIIIKLEMLHYSADLIYDFCYEPYYRPIFIFETTNTIFNVVDFITKFLVTVNQLNATDV